MGVAAHITAASPGGPRYNPRLTHAERTSETNGVWLCQKCAKAVDDDPATYTVAQLREWRSKAETRARHEIESGPRCAPSVVSTPALSVLSHRAFFYGSSAEHYFIKIVNLAPSADAEVTHVWYEYNNQRIDILNRPLPVRLRPSETWETYISVAAVPVDPEVFEHFRVLMSTGEVFASKHNKNVPPAGYVAGR